MRFLSLLACLILLPSAASATTMTYTMTAVSEGNFAGSHLKNALVTLSGTADSSTIQQSGGTFKAALSGTTVTVAGRGTANFTDAMTVQLSQTSTVLGIYDVTAGYGILGIMSPEVSTYDLQSDFSKTAVPVGSAFQTFNTSSGSLYLWDFKDNTFTASGSGISFVPPAPAGGTPTAVTPESSSLLLLATGMAGAAGLLRRRVLGGS